MLTAWKVSEYGVIYGPYFYGVNFRIQSEYSKIRARNNSVYGHISYSGCFSKTMENVRKHRGIKMILRHYLVSEPNYHTTEVFHRISISDRNEKKINK